MKFSTRTTYGLRAMIILASDNQKKISLPSIAAKEKISGGYLEKIFADLKKAKLVESVKGSRGGYSLSRSSKRIEVYEIINSLEGAQANFHCLDSGGKVYCHPGCSCGSIKVMMKVQDAVNKALKDIKLSDLT